MNRFTNMAAVKDRLERLQEFSRGYAAALVWLVSFFQEKPEADLADLVFANFAVTSKFAKENVWYNRGYAQAVHEAINGIPGEELA